MSSGASRKPAYTMISHFGISQVMFKIETSNQIKLGYLITNIHIPI